MKNIIGKARIYPPAVNRGKLRVYFHKDVLEIIGHSVDFDIKKLIVTRASIDSTRAHELNNKQLWFKPIEDESFYLGFYNVIQKDEDTFKLKRCH